ncbi:cytochrome c3 family protein [Coralloluteibacterium stylophorae]|uniref:Cytochrome c3 family protein n=1 Tax=Coralloluteibacterium stylophorae TaxID=1776034 RepID=A0A8J7VSQ2_9GAMM|nr:cytochrome c3 family protein [Coralloluteibacterium stylophorae]MBS7456400.1 cytochrome c3 family protein [Coralloluteibacterium stylophorae]
MTQTFSRQAQLFIKLVLLGGVGGVVVAALAWKATTARPYAQGEPVVQPVPFSHKHHVADDGIDCRYCHTGVETDAFAGMPPLSTCMTCHSQLYTDEPVLAPLIAAWTEDTPLPWRRVHDLPDFVYFDHSAHVTHGVGCSSCHGRVDRMPLTWRAAPLTMEWCLDCHRRPERHLRPADAVFDMAWTPPPDQLRRGRELAAHYRIDRDRLIECSTCHR